jgi:hypothetical protein
MHAFLEALTHYPGIVPSVLVGVLLVFWLMAILGALDFEHFGPDWLGEHHHDLDAHTEGAPNMLLALGFERLPFSVVVSAIGFVWWLLTMLAAQYLAPLIPLPGWLSGSVMLLIALIAAVPVAGLIVRPLKPLFVVHQGSTTQNLIGRPCRILTLKVDESFGQAEVKIDNGIPLNVRVRARSPNTLSRGSSALIIDLDTSSGRFDVEPYDSGPS